MTDDLIQGWNDLKDGLPPAYLLQEYGSKLANALEAAKREIERISALATHATDEWQSWVDDQLQGTSLYDDAIADVNAHRAALSGERQEGEG